ncbi:MAG TPA: thiamine phosphate synthase [Terriglobia bacterium]|nr:thiamine phosphate synthase [Terriglobia bacterium]
MLLPFPRLYAIVDGERTGERPPERVCRELLAAGVRLFQYRDKRGPSRQVLETLRVLVPMVRAQGGWLIVNDRADLALVADADGVHLGQDDLPLDLARRVLKPGQWVGYSTHNLEQVRRADGQAADYVAFGPIYSTASKHAPDPIVGLENLRRARQATSKPLVAIGGITPENARQVIEQGADSVAVISGLLDAADLGARAAEFLRILGQ